MDGTQLSLFPEVKKPDINKVCSKFFNTGKEFAVEYRLENKTPHLAIVYCIGGISEMVIYTDYHVYVKMLKVFIENIDKINFDNLLIQAGVLELNQERVTKLAEQFKIELSNNKTISVNKYAEIAYIMGYNEALKTK